MKKIISLALSAMLALGLCASAFAAESGDVEVTMFQLKVEIDPQLQAYAAAYSEATDGVTVKVETLGGGADFAGALKAKLQANQMPTIFQFEGRGGYELWKDYMSDMKDAAWVADTDLAFIGDDGAVVGFPVAIEGYGLGYNAELLEKAGVDPATLTTYSAVKEAFEKIDGMKEELGIDSVVSMAASIAGGMWWVTGNHGFNAYLAGGLAYDDTSIVDSALAGELDEARLTEYVTYLKLLYDYANQDVLTNGNYDAQIAAFAEGKAAFIHQGNWTDPNMVQLNADFEMSYAPHAFSDTQEMTGLYMAAPSWYCVNSQAPEAEKQAAIDFLTAMATTEEGANYMVNEAGMVPAFKSVSIMPEGQFSKALVEANAKGGNYNWYFGLMPDGFVQNTLGPIFDMFAQDTSDISTVIGDLTAAFAEIAQ